MIIRRLLLGLLLLAQSNTAFSDPEPVELGYQVMAYNAQTHRYTIYRHDIVDGKYTLAKMVIECMDPNISCEGMPIGRLYPLGYRNDKNKNVKDWHIIDAREWPGDRFLVSDETELGKDFFGFKIISIELLPSLRPGKCTYNGEPAPC